MRHSWRTTFRAISLTQLLDMHHMRIPGMHQTHVSARLHALLGRPRVVPRALGCGARRGGACTSRLWALAGLRGARAGRSKSLDLACNHGIAFRPAEPSKVMETPKMSFILFCFSLCCCTRYKYHTSPQDVYQAHFDAAMVQQQPRFQLSPS